ncbi:MAG: serine/threonine protein kinase [Candidatus Obscuribacterales bacterium]|nr:serine/threonine protein kinase [Candidatus Obscuribacterales bacterium]
MKNVLLDDSLVGQTVGETFVITRWIGMGGMGTAYEAKQIDLDRRVCIKFLKVEGLSDSESFQRFKREARVLSKLQHDYIVSCFSFGLYESIYPFLVLELVEGPSLKELAAESAMEWKRACLLLMQLCQALEFAHKRGFVHRDLKPENILVTSVAGEEGVKLIDFGLVGLQTEETAEKLTAPGSIMGSVNYMAPECFRGGAPHKAQDIYAFGCVMYYLLSGLLPFAAESAMAVMYKHANERLPGLPPNLVPDDVRDSLERIIWKCTAATVADRPDDCSEIRRLLSGALDGLTQSRIPTIDVPKSRSHRPAVVLGVVICISLIALFLLGPWRPVAINRKVKPAETVLAQIAAIAAPAKATPATREASRQELVKTDLLSIDRTVKDLNMSWGRQKTTQEHKVLTAQTEQLRDKLESFLRNDGRFLNQTSEVSPEVRELCLNLGDLLVTLGPKVSNVRLETSLKDLQCDLLTSSGCYSGGIEIVRSGKPLQRPFVIARGDQSELAKFHELVCGQYDVHPPELARVITRLRPVIHFYPRLKNGDVLFSQFLSRYQLFCTLSCSPDHWQPSLLLVASELDLRNQEQVSNVLMKLLEIEIASGRIAQAQQILAILVNSFLPSHLDVEQVGERFFEVGQVREGESFLNAAIGRAKMRNQMHLFCRYKMRLLLLLASGNNGARSVNEALAFLKTPEWTTLESQLLRGDDVVAQSSALNILRDLNEIAGCCFRNNQKKEGLQLLNECQRLLLAAYDNGISLSLYTPYTMQLYGTIQRYSNLGLFNESLPLRETLCSMVDGDKAQPSDGFVPLAANVELARALWISGRQGESRRYFRKAIMEFPRLVNRCTTPGWSEWLMLKLDWFRSAGFVKEANQMQATLKKFWH